MALKRYAEVKIEKGANGPICTVRHDKIDRIGCAARHLPYWFRPSQYWGHGGPLVEEFKLDLRHDRPHPLDAAMRDLLLLSTGKHSAYIPDEYLTLES